MINIFLDDERPAPMRFDGNPWHVTMDMEWIKEQLIKGRVNELSLDHDLGVCSRCQIKAASAGKDAGASCFHVGTGYDLAKWMAETGHWSKVRPICHSANPVGKRNILSTIDRYFPLTLAED